MIEASGLSKSFGPFKAVDSISFTVQPGEVLGFLGPNGAGKSTTMKMIAGFLAPTAGSAKVAGHDVISQPMAARSALGYLPEGAPAYGEMEVAAFLEFIAAVRSIPVEQRTKRLESTVARLQLGDVLRQPIDTLSKGFRRRVGLAAAIIHDPPVLILDEPTDGLDPNQKHEVRTLIRELAGQRTILLSTHILEEVEAVCTRAIIIARGKLLIDATPAQLLAKSRYDGAVSVKATDSVAAMAALEGLPQAAGFRIDEHDSRVYVFARNHAALGEPVADRLRQRQIQFSELRIEHGRLDDVFRAITTGEAA